MSITIPQVFDAWQRAGRTVVQVALGFISLAALVPLIVSAIGAPADSDLGIWLAAAATWVTAVAGALSRIMAIPGVNALLTKIGLGGHSGNLVANDSQTSFITLPPTSQPAVADAAADAPAPDRTAAD